MYPERQAFSAKAQARYVLPTPAGPVNDDILVFVHPRATGQSLHDFFVEPSGVSEVNVLDTRPFSKVSLSQTLTEFAILSVLVFTVDEQTNALFEVQRVNVILIELLL